MAKRKKKSHQDVEVKDPVATSQTEEPDSNLQTIEGLEKEREELNDRLLRRQAEFDNFRKRILKEKEEERLLAHSELLKQLLPVVDACEKGLQTMNEQSDNPKLETYREGYELLIRQVKSVLERFGVTEIAGVGACFDPNVHEAVSKEVTSEHEEGKIVDEFQKGYKIRDRLLRPAQVRVTVRPGETG